MNDYKQRLDSILIDASQKGASDIHISPAHYIMLRINAELVPQQDFGVINNDISQGMADTIFNEKEKQIFEEKKDVDFTYSINQELRFRVNAYHTHGGVAMVFHSIAQQVKSLQELGLPQSVEIFSKLNQGFVITVGATGQGKSTTLSSLIQTINHERTKKIVTIEDPIEFIFTSEKSIIDQREISDSANSFASAIRASLRENIDVLLIGEMRDLETMEAAIIAAETGHLVFSTLHTNSAVQTLDRIVSVFPTNQQKQVVIQLAGSLSGVISQRLIPSIKGGLVPAVEVMVATAGVRNVIRTHEFNQLQVLIDTGSQEGMLSFNQSLAQLTKRGQISSDNAYFYSTNPKELKQLLENRN